jgi:hypothetical protein
MLGKPHPTLVALHRFGLGARPGDWPRANADQRAFVLGQLTGPPPAIGEDLPASDEATRQRRAAEIIREEERKRPTPTPEATPPKDQPPVVEVALFRAEAGALFQQLASTDRGLVERLVLFWSNHFTVSAAKGGAVRAIVGAFVREAIRPHVLGRFADMLLAVEQHPVMLIYLDNNASIGPKSRDGLSRSRGLNENLARETLELHTLGVDGGYTQEDVTALARIYTGWTFNAPDADALFGGRFTFAPVRHEPGAQILLGRTYPEGGLAQGRAALSDLARHPSTARFIARKLARHFVADEPPPALVARLEAAFTASGGDLLMVTRALIEAPEAWSAPLAKLRPPVAIIAGLLRAAGRPPDTVAILNNLNLMGQPLWQAPGPNGWPDASSAWLAPEAMAVRLEIAVQRARRAGGVDPLDLMDKLLGAAVSRETRETVARAESRAQGLALLFLSPEFQRQ